MRWLSEQEYRLSGAEATGITFNVAFLLEIKSDFGFRDLLQQVRSQLCPDAPTIPVQPRQAAAGLKDDHESLYLELSRVIEMAQQLVYQECGPEFTVVSLGHEFARFHKNLMRHEEAEMNLMMTLCNEDFGVGD